MRAVKVIVVLVLIAACGLAVLNVHIRHQRKLLQTRAKQFLSRPVPTLFNTNELGGYVESQDGNVLIRSRTLIERYATNGRIRWSARIQGEMASAPFGMDVCEQAAKTDEERQYITECKAIVDAECRMGFWQWVEDTVEMKRVIPEIAEEDAPPSKRFDAGGSTNKAAPH
jgi:hypothetical protein